MTDLEMTKLCAEAMKLTPLAVNGGEVVIGVTPNRYVYAPLRNDAQAMTLISHLRLHINDMQDGNTRAWGVFPGARGGLGTYGRDLNRAIVECVSKIQSSKS